MTVDGKKIAEVLEARLKDAVVASHKQLRLGIVLATSDPATQAFVRKKEEFGKRIGVDVRVYNEMENAVSARRLRDRVSELTGISENSALIVQLPLPEAVGNVQKVLNAVVPEKDADMLSARSIGDFMVGTSDTMPPVVGAIQEIFKQEKVFSNLAGIKVVVIGAGPVAGRPVSQWLIHEGAAVTVVTKETAHEDITYYTKTANLIIACAGSPGLVTGDMVKDDVVAIDVGVTKIDGKFKGDFDFDSVAPKAKLITPPIGGIGPIVVAKVFENVLRLNKIKIVKDFY